jgi:diguanylate cyclase (GGDEF)-like protein
MAARDSGVASYLPLKEGHTIQLVIETPVYRDNVPTSSVSARRHAFLGWLGDILVPGVVLARALEGHPHLAVAFRYDDAHSHTEFTNGNVPSGAQRATIDLHNGWSVQSSEIPVADGVLSSWTTTAMLIGGTLLSILIGTLLLVLATGRSRARSLVRERTGELAERNRELSHQAMHDPLTGLPNRALVLDRAKQLIAAASRTPESLVGALFIDLDGFKHVNDSLGHATGDQLLRAVGGRLDDSTRAQDTVGRLSGDEFVVLVGAPNAESTVALLAQRIIATLREPIELEDKRQIRTVTASIGATIGPYDSPDALLRDADLALYAAKNAGKNRYTMFAEVAVTE